MRKRILGLVLAVALSPGVTRAQPAPPSGGYRLAADVCARCHVIVAHGPGSWTDAPPFEAIANRPATTRRWLVDFISKPHKDMLTRDYSSAQVNSLADYIFSLRRQ